MIEVKEDVWPAMKRRRLPKYMANGLELYLFNLIPPGDFMISILTNDLKEAVKRADAQNRFLLAEWAELMINDLPMSAQGSVEIVNEWLHQADEKE